MDSGVCRNDTGRSHRLRELRSFRVERSRRRAGRPQGWRRRRRSGRGGAGHPEECPGGSSSDRECGSVLDDLGEGAGHRTVDQRVLPRRRLRQEGRPAVQHRPEAPRGGAEPDEGQPGEGRSHPGTGSGQPGKGRGPGAVCRGAGHPLPAAIRSEDHLAGPGRATACQCRCDRAGGGGGPGDHRERQGLDRREPGGGRKRPGTAQLHQHPVADRRAHGEPDGETGQRGDGEFAGVDDHQPGGADLRDVLRSGVATDGDQELHGAGQAAGAGAAAGRSRGRGNGRFDVYRQRRRHYDRDHQVEGHVRESGPQAVARPVRAGDAASDDAAGRGGGAQRSGAERAERLVCVRGEAGPYSGFARGNHGRAGGPGHGGGVGPGTRARRW